MADERDPRTGGEAEDEEAGAPTRGGDLRDAPSQPPAEGADGPDGERSDPEPLGTGTGAAAWEADRPDTPSQPSAAGATGADGERNPPEPPGTETVAPAAEDGDPVASGASGRASPPFAGQPTPVDLMAGSTNGHAADVLSGADPAGDGSDDYGAAAPADGPQAAPDGVSPAASAPPDEATDAEAAGGGVGVVEPPAIHPAEVIPPDGGGQAGGPPGGGEPPGGGGGPPGRRAPEPEDKPMSVVEHLDELRRRLMWMIGSLLAGVAIGFSFVKPMLGYLELPLHGLKLYITAPLDPLFAFVKISVAFGLVVASPVILYQLVAYVLPALTRLERRLLFSYLPAATGLFITGLAFGFYVFIPLVIEAMLRFAGTSLTPILTIDKYISFLLSFTLPFGVVFEMPVIVVTLVRLGILSPQTLAGGRRWALMVTVVIAAIFAPPDPITPLVMALPIYGLYEVSIWVARLAARGRPAE